MTLLKIKKCKENIYLITDFTNMELFMNYKQTKTNNQAKSKMMLHDSYFVYVNMYQEKKSVVIFCLTIHVIGK